MVQKNNVRKTEFILFLVLATTLLFLFTNFDERTGTAYLSIIIIDVLLIFSEIFVFDGKLDYPFKNKAKDFFKSVGIGLALYPLFLVITMVVVQLINIGIAFSPFSILEIQAQTIPVFAGSFILRQITLNIIAPLSEQRFFFSRLIESVSQRIGIKKLSLTNPVHHLVYIFISVIWILFHFTAKALAIASGGIAGFNSAIIAVFIFGYMSCLITVWRKQSIEGTAMHIANNTTVNFFDFLRRGTGM